MPQARRRHSGRLSLERALLGKALTELANTDRGVGNLSRRPSERAASLYANFVAGNFVIASADTAELVKLMEADFRDVNAVFAK